MIYLCVIAAMALVYLTGWSRMKTCLARERERGREMEAGLERYDEIRASEGDEAADAYMVELRERLKDRP